MQFQACLICLLAVGVNANTLEVTPVQKVVTLLEGMLAKGKAEKLAEQVAFAASKQFCDDTRAEKTSAIRDEDQSISTLGAEIQKDGADAARMGQEIRGLQVDESTWTGDMKAAAGVRIVEKADYDKTHADYSESIEAIGRAVAVLKAQTHDRQQAGSLVQVSSLQRLDLIPADAKKTIDMFLQTGGHDAVADMAGAPEANGYEFQAGGVVDMLEKLQRKFIDERATLAKEEVNSKQAFELLKERLTEQVAQAKKDESQTGIAKGKKLQSQAMERSDQNEEIAIENTDTRYLSDLTVDCKMTAADFEARQQLRTQEIEAIEKTIGIISGDAVAGNAGRHLPAFLQKKAVALPQMRTFLKSGAMMQLRADQQNAQDAQAQRRVAVLLDARAKQLNSAVLEAVAAHAAADPFSKVKKMIKDLVVRLMEEANEESDHKGWCDTELSTNKQTRQEKTDIVQTLNSDIDLLKASISKVAGDITELSEAVAGLSTAMSTATKLREEEKVRATATVSDSQDAQTALAQALTVLKDFYSTAAEATAFVQTVAPYNGMASENGGVIAMLEVIESDFARLESETKASEATAQKQYDTFMTDSKTDKASKDTAIEHKQAKSQDATQSLTEKEADLAGTQKELDAALSYYDKLRPSCVDAGSTYEDRVARRQQEVESLQEALKVMNGDDLA